MKNKIYFSLFLIVFLLSCNLSDKEELENRISAQYIDWTVYNLEAGSIGDETAYIKFFIQFESKNLQIYHLDEIKITSPEGRTWTFDSYNKINPNFDRNDKAFTTNQLFSSSHPNYMPIGDYEILITDNNDIKKKYTINIPVPGEASSLDYVNSYTEDYLLDFIPESNQVPMLNRAKIKSVEKVPNEVAVTFLIEDDRVGNGSVYLYNGSGKLMAISNHFINKETDDINNQLNNGVSFNRNGSDNVLLLTEEGLDYKSDDYLISSIKKVKILLEDGEKYEGKVDSNFVSLSSYRID